MSSQSSALYAAFLTTPQYSFLTCSTLCGVLTHPLPCLHLSHLCQILISLASSNSYMELPSLNPMASLMGTPCPSFSKLILSSQKRAPSTAALISRSGIPHQLDGYSEIWAPPRCCHKVHTVAPPPTHIQAATKSCLFDY